MKLSFINNNFEETKEGLSWDGEVDGILTSITVKLPLQESVYEAWQHPVGHCHGHVWWTMPAPSPSPTPTPPGFEAIFAITSTLAVAFLVLRKKK